MKEFDIQRNEREIVRVALSEFNEREYIDIRIFYKDEASGEYKPTKKGVTLAKELYPELKKAILDIGDVIGEEG